MWGIHVRQQRSVPGESERVEVQFDQYQRYRTAARVLELVGAGAALEVLEVGANIHRNLERFAPGHRITYLDRELPEAVSGDTVFIRADATAMPFGDGGFDVVVALDVFEHVPPWQREVFVRELARVARKGVLLAAPFDTPGVREVEQSANAFYRTLHGVEHPWLIEHLGNGLPELAATEEKFANCGFAVEAFGHGRAFLWLALMQANIAGGACPELAEQVAELDRIYAHDLYSSDTGRPCYRHFLFASPNPVLATSIQVLFPPDEQHRSLEREVRKTAEDLARTAQEQVENRRSRSEAERRGVAGRAWRVGRRHLVRLGRVPEISANVWRSGRRLGWRAAGAEAAYWARRGLPGLTSLWGKVLDAANYARWVREREGQRQGRAGTEKADQLPFAPRFATVILAGPQSFRGLESTLASLAAQTYPRWSGIVLYHGAPNGLERLRGDFPEIEFRQRLDGEDANGDTQLRKAAHQSDAEFAIALRPGVVLHATALMSLAVACTKCPEIDVLYVDEDRLDRHGMRYDPFLKPDWNPELMRSQNYFGVLVAIRAARLRTLPALDALPNALLDWARNLWVTAAVPGTRIHHIPEILCHVADGSAAARVAYGRSEDQATLLSCYAREHGIAATVVEVPGTSPRLRYEVPGVAPLVSVIIPTRNGVDLVARCIRSIRERTYYPAFEILVVDNGSDDPATLKYLDDLQQSSVARVLRYGAPFNYSAINNFAVARAAGDLVCLLNNDTEVISPDWLGEMVGHAMQPGVGAVGAMLYYPDDTIQHAGITLGLGGLAGHRFIAKPRGYAGPRERLRHAQNLSAVTAACLVVRKQVYLEVDGLDEESFPVAYNDVDFCLRARAHGYRNVWTPFAELYHYEGASRGRDNETLETERYRRESAQFSRRWGDVLRSDPHDRPDLQSERPAALNEPPFWPSAGNVGVPRINETAV